MLVLLGLAWCPTSTKPFSFDLLHQFNLLLCSKFFNLSLTGTAEHVAFWVGFRILFELIERLLLIHKLDVVFNSFESGEQSDLVHDILPVRAVFAECLWVVLEDQVIVKAKIRVLKLHVIRIYLLAFKRVAQVLLQEAEQLSILLHYGRQVGIKHHFLLRESPSLLSYCRWNVGGATGQASQIFLLDAGSEDRFWHVVSKPGAPILVLHCGRRIVYFDQIIIFLVLVPAAISILLIWQVFMACINQSVSAGALTNLLAAVIAIQLGKVELSITFLCSVLTQLLTLLQLMVDVILF